MNLLGRTDSAQRLGRKETGQTATIVGVVCPPAGLLLIGEIFRRTARFCRPGKYIHLHLPPREVKYSRELEKSPGGRKVACRIVPAVSGGRKDNKSRRAILSALRPTRLGVLFAMLIGLGVGFWQWGKPPKPRVVLENRGPVTEVIFSPDGQTLAIIEGDRFNHSLALWNVSAGRKELDLFKDTQVTRVAFSPDGRKVACSFPESSGVWDLTDGRELVTYDHPHHLVFSKGKLFAIGQQYELLDMVTNKIVKNPDELGSWPPTGGDRRITGGKNNAILLRDAAGTVRVWDLFNATFLAERRDIPDVLGGLVKLASENRFLIVHSPVDEGPFTVFICNLTTGQKLAASNGASILTGVALAPDGESVAIGVEQSFATLSTKSWWHSFTEWLGIQIARSDYYVSLRAFPSGEEITVLNDCMSPVLSPDGRTLAVTSADGKSLQLWDLPIRKPIGKILAQAGLAALATLLAFNGLGCLRRRRMRLKANVPTPTG
jgi:WD40 repeat protein